MARARSTVVAALPALLVLPIGAVVTAPLQANDGLLSTSGMFAAVVAIALGATLALSWRTVPRAGTAAALGVLAWAIGIALLVGTSIDDPIVSDRAVRCGTGLMGFYMIVLPLLGAALVSGSIALAAAAANRAVDPFVRIAAPIAVVMACAACAHGAARGRPTAAAFVQTLPPNGDVRVGETIAIASQTVRYAETTANDAPEPMCLLHVGSQSADYWRCPSLRLRYDTPSRMLFVTPVDDAGGEGAASAFAIDTGAVVAVRPSMLPGRIAPPRAWPLNAATFGGLSLLLLVASRAIRRRVEGTEATHEGEGAIAVDGVTVLVPTAIGLPVGPVVVRCADASPGYRTHAGPSIVSVEAGTLESIAAAEKDRVTSVLASALAIAVVGAAPLLVAWAHGM
jgi:hypothetical protein